MPGNLSGRTDGQTDGRTDGHAVKRLRLVGWTNGPMYLSKEGISGFGRTDGRRDGRTDGQPENIMPPAPKGGGIKNYSLGAKRPSLLGAKRPCAWAFNPTVFSVGILSQTFDYCGNGYFKFNIYERHGNAANHLTNINRILGQYTWYNSGNIK